MTGAATGTPNGESVERVPVEVGPVGIVGLMREVPDVVAVPVAVTVPVGVAGAIVPGCPGTSGN